MNKYIVYNKIIFLAAAAVTTAMLAFVFNAYNQAYVLNKAFKPDAQIAVFITEGFKAAPEVVLEKLANLDGVDKADFMPAEKVLEKAQSENSKLKNIVIAGENPFSAYYIVTPKRVGVASAKNLTEKIKKIEGVEDAVFDENLFSAVEKTGEFARIYSATGKAVAAVVLMLIALKFFLRWQKKEIEVTGYVYNFLLGIISGALGAGIFYIAAHNMSHTGAVSLPVKYLAYCIAGGVLISLMWENDRG